MKKDTEVKLYMQERRKGTSQRVAAARAGMSERTGRKYEQARQLPSHLKTPHTWQTRINPFEEDWPWVVSQLERDPARPRKTLFALLCERHPGRYQATQVRTLQRHIARWRALHGPEQEVIFEQRHIPGERAQSDFTHMADLGVTIAGEAFPHMVYHFVLTYSNTEAASICFSETFEALAEGIEKALWQIGGVPEQHRTDHRSRSGASPGQVWTGRLDQALRCAHGPLRHATNLEQHRGSSREWGCRTVPLPLQRGCRSSLAHPRQSRVSQSSRLRPRISHELVRQRNLTRSVRFRAEGEVLRPLPAAPLAPCKEVRLRVSRFSTIHLDSNVYSVPSRLIGTSVVVRVRAETLEGFVGSGLAFTLPRLVGKHRHHIDYHHLIWSLVRKPGAFAAYRYRDDLFPTTTFRLAYDRLLSQKTKRADREYVRVLHLAATTSESEVEIALSLLLEAGRLPSFEAVRDLVHLPRPQAIPQLQAPTLDLSPYDQLIPSRRSHA